MSTSEPPMSIKEQLEMEGAGWDGDLDAMRSPRCDCDSPST